MKLGWDNQHRTNMRAGQWGYSGPSTRARGQKIVKGPEAGEREVIHVSEATDCVWCSPSEVFVVLAKSYHGWTPSTPRPGRHRNNVHVDRCESRHFRLWSLKSALANVGSSILARAEPLIENPESWRWLGERRICWAYSYCRRENEVQGAKVRAELPPNHTAKSSRLLRDPRPDSK